MQNINLVNALVEVIIKVFTDPRIEAFHRRLITEELDKRDKTKGKGHQTRNYSLRKLSRCLACLQIVKLTAIYTITSSVD
jgi:hypothetical protein